MFGYVSKTRFEVMEERAVAAEKAAENLREIVESLEAERDITKAAARRDRDHMIHWQGLAKEAQGKIARMTGGLKQNRRGCGSVAAPADGLTTLNA